MMYPNIAPLSHPAPEALARLPAFGPGVMVMTTDGELPVEWLATGDRVVTRDHGAQPLLWVGRARLSREKLRHDPGLAPVELARGALGAGCPTHQTRLSPAARVLLAGAEVSLHAGVDEALAEIGQLADGGVLTVPPCVEGSHYTSLLLPMHAVVQANGLWVETLLLDRATRLALGGALPAALRADLALQAGHDQAARLCLAGWEVTAMRGPRSADRAPQLIQQVA